MLNNVIKFHKKTYKQKQNIKWQFIKQKSCNNHIKYLLKKNLKFENKNNMMS